MNCWITPEHGGAAHARVEPGSADPAAWMARQQPPAQAHVSPSPSLPALQDRPGFKILLSPFAGPVASAPPFSPVPCMLGSTPCAPAIAWAHGSLCPIQASTAGEPCMAPQHDVIAKSAEAPAISLSGHLISAHAAGMATVPTWETTELQQKHDCASACQFTDEIAMTDGPGSNNASSGYGLAHLGHGGRRGRGISKGPNSASRGRGGRGVGRGKGRGSRSIRGRWGSYRPRGLTRSSISMHYCDASGAQPLLSPGASSGAAPALESKALGTLTETCTGHGVVPLQARMALPSASTSCMPFASTDSKGCRMHACRGLSSSCSPSTSAKSPPPDAALLEFKLAHTSTPPAMPALHQPTPSPAARDKAIFGNETWSHGISRSRRRGRLGRGKGRWGRGRARGGIGKNQRGRGRSCKPNMPGGASICSGEHVEEFRAPGSLRGRGHEPARRGGRRGRARGRSDLQGKAAGVCSNGDSNRGRCKVTDVWGTAGDEGLGKVSSKSKGQMQRSTIAGGYGQGQVLDARSQDTLNKGQQSNTYEQLHEAVSAPKSNAISSLSPGAAADLQVNFKQQCLQGLWTEH